MLCKNKYNKSVFLLFRLPALWSNIFYVVRMTYAVKSISYPTTSKNCFPVRDHIVAITFVGIRDLSGFLVVIIIDH